MFDANFFMWVIAAAFAFGALVTMFVIAFIREPGKKLCRKFTALGPAEGKTKGEIVALIGRPNAISAMPDGKTQLQWQEFGCLIALQFSGEVCDGIVHEYCG